MSEPAAGKPDALANSADGVFDDPFDTAPPDEKVELRALKQALQLAAQSPAAFRLIFARCDVTPYRQRLIARLQSELPALNIQVINFDQPIKHLLDEMRPRIADPLPDAIFITGLESSVAESSVEGGKSPFIANLNAARNSFSRIVPRPLVWWVTEKTLAVVFGGAPDFFSIRAGVYFFVAAPESAGEIASSLTGETTQQIENLMRAEKQDRIAAIRSLLADYESHPADKRDLDAEMNLNFQLGALYYARGAADEARMTNERALAIARQLDDKHNEGVILGNLGLAYSALGEVRRAIEHYEQALAISREIGDRRGEGADLGNLGNAYSALGEVRRAIEHYEQALAIAREIGDRRGEGAHLGNLGLAYSALGEVRRAIEHYEQALAIAREIGDRRNEGAWLGNLGNAYLKLEEWEKSVECYEQALAIAREIENKNGESIYLTNLGGACRKMGAAKQAIEYYELALTIDREVGDTRGEAIDLGSIGDVHLGSGDAKRAVEYFDLALNAARNSGDQELEAEQLERLSRAWEKLGDRDRAIANAESALEIYEKTGSEEAESVRERLAELRSRTGKKAV